jgi:hypothetical protein
MRFYQIRAKNRWTPSGMAKQEIRLGEADRIKFAGQRCRDQILAQF